MVIARPNNDKAPYYFHNVNLMLDVLTIGGCVDLSKRGIEHHAKQMQADFRDIDI